MQVDPDLPATIVADTWILLVVQSIQGSTNSVVQLGDGEGERGEDEGGVGRGGIDEYLSFRDRVSDELGVLDLNAEL